MTCTACGQKLPLGAAFCPYCGAAAPSQSQPEPAPACEGSAPEETPEKPPCVPEAICPPADAQAAARAAQNPAKRRPKVRSLKYRAACACGNIFCALCCSAFLCWGSSPWWRGPSAGMCAKKSAAFRAPRFALQAWCWPPCCWRLCWPWCCCKPAPCLCKAWCRAPLRAFCTAGLDIPLHIRYTTYRSLGG